MEIPRSSHHAIFPDANPAACDEAARTRAAMELCAAIAMVERNPIYRVVVCSQATSASLLADLDPLAAEAGIVLERRIRAGGGGFDVVVRAA
ncbi:MAG: hypothetical protein MUE92_07810 [Chloroflexi bacterium]|jgi:hypothetical protein|nr:hypothetical protein [Chloroflexota bacterium]